MISPIPDDFSDLIDPEEDIEIPQDECCHCLSSEVATIVRIQEFVYPFCGQCDQRAFFLKQGRALGWPALRYEGPLGKYALDNDIQAWAFTALTGEDNRVWALVEAIGDYETEQERLAS